MNPNPFHIHLISDSTGETLDMVTRASLAQFDDLEPTVHTWTLVRNEVELEDVLGRLEKHPGFVLYTMVDDPLRRTLESACRRMGVPCVSVLDPVVRALGAYLGADIHARPGRQHMLGAEYFDRMAAMDFTLSHDDGQSVSSLNEADVIVFGVSRTSKTPTCIYLAHRGIRAANMPLVPDMPIPPEALASDRPFRVGLTKDPRQLVQIRKNRLRMMGQEEDTDYIDLDTVSREVSEARKLYTSNNWPVIDVTRRSIEETAAQILQLYNRRREEST